MLNPHRLYRNLCPARGDVKTEKGEVGRRRKEGVSLVPVDDPLLSLRSSGPRVRLLVPQDEPLQGEEEDDMGPMFLRSPREFVSFVVLS